MLLKWMRSEDRTIVHSGVQYTLTEYMQKLYFTHLSYLKHNRIEHLHPQTNVLQQLSINWVKSAPLWILRFSKTNRVHIKAVFTKINCNNLVQLNLSYSTDASRLDVFRPVCACYTPYQSHWFHHPCLDHSNTIWWKVYRLLINCLLCIPIHSPLVPLISNQILTLALCSQTPP
jgi:hypothetical protein